MVNLQMIRQRIQNPSMNKLFHVGTKEQLADGFTKWS